MAIPKKKHLIDLMIEAGVNWPEGAKYAAQNKDTMRVRFYKKGKPIRDLGADYWNSFGGSLISGVIVKLPELCLNWHKTIVTREQYAEAVLMQTITGNDEQVKQPHSEVAGVIPSESIESLLAKIKAKREEHDKLAAKVDALVLEIVSIEQQVNDKINEYGVAIFPLAAPYKPKQPVITDWRDLKIDDVIGCVLVHGVDGVESDESNNKFHGAECRVIGLTSTGINHIETDLKPDGYYIQEFKFISRQ